MFDYIIDYDHAAFSLLYGFVLGSVFTLWVGAIWTGEQLKKGKGCA